VSESMSKSAAPVCVLPVETRVFPSYELRKLIGRRADRLAEPARQAILKAGMSAEMHFVQFVHDGLHFALASRVDKVKGTLDIDVGLADPVLNVRPISAAEHRRAEEKRKERGGRASAAVTVTVG